MKLSDRIQSLWDHLPKNKPAFAFVAFFVVYGFYHISDVLWLSIILAAFGLYCEYEAQWVWGYAMAAKKARMPWKRWAFVNVLYILILALPTFIGFVYTEIAARTETTEIIEQTQTNNQAYIDNLNEQIRTLTQNKDKEYNEHGGNGLNYKTMQKDLNKLNDRLDKAMNPSKKKTSETVTVIKKDMFTNVADLFGVHQKFWIIVPMLAASLMMAYVGLWKKPMIIALESNDTLKNNNVTQNVTRVADDVTDEEDPNCICGCGNPRMQNSKYFSDSCRTTYKRKKDKEKLKIVKAEGNES